MSGYGQPYGAPGGPVGPGGPGGPAGPGGPGGPVGPGGPGGPGFGGPGGGYGPAKSPTDLGPIMGYVAGGAGLLAFVWGFLDFFKQKGGGSNSGLPGYFGIGAAAIGLVLVAGLVAVLNVLAKKPLGTAPFAASVAGLLVTFGQMVKHGDGLDTGTGLILLLITALVQVGALGYELFAISKLIGGSAGPAGAGTSSFAPQGQPGSFGAPAAPTQYGQPGAPQYGPGGQPPYGAPGGYQGGSQF